MADPAETLTDAIDDAEPGRPSATNDNGEPCPMTPVGYSGRKYFIMNRRGDVLSFTGRELYKQEAYGELFGQDQGWLYDSFPNEEKRGFNAAKAQRWFIDHCHARGYYKEADIRSVGTYRHRSRVIVHCGDAVYTASGEWQPPGEIGSYIYVGAAPIPRPAIGAEATPQVAEEMLQLLSSWCWKTPEIGPRLVLGQIHCAFLPGATDWRPHMLLTGFKGTGKTWLVKLLKDTIGHGYFAESSEATPAYVRDELAGSVRPMFLDEFEQEVGTAQYASMLVRLARLASSRFQSGVGRSSTERKTSVTKIDACFIFTGINPPALEPADAGRITVLDLMPFNSTDPDQARHVLAEIDRLSRHGPALFARALERFDTFEINLAVYRTELMARGCDSRATDQYSHLLAGADVFLSDTPTDMTTARRIVELLGPAGLMPDDDEDNEAAICAQHLLTTALRSEDRTMNGKTVGELLLQILDGRELAAAPVILGLLKRHGLNLVKHNGQEYVLVANRHHALGAIYAPTKWANGAWKNILSKHRGALRGRPTVRFHGVTTKAAWIPAGYLVQPDAPMDTSVAGAAHAGPTDPGLPEPGDEPG